jgi:protein TonB
MSLLRTGAAVVVAFVITAAAARAGAPTTTEIDLVATPPSAGQRLEMIRERVQDAVVYPQTARERGIEGTARIQFRIAPDGRAAEIATVASSGSELLDSAAEQAARNARALPQLYGWVRIPVRFALEGRRTR